MQGVSHHDHEALLERRQRVATMTRQGLSATEIATALRVTPRTVVRDRQATGCAKPCNAREKRLRSDELQRAEQLLNDGCSYADVARTLGRSPQAIRYHFPGRGWTFIQCGQYAMTVRHLNTLKAIA